jgi:two-component system probable response regulator PhcQ
MQTTDHRQYSVLYVDDEERSLASFERAFCDEFRVLTASSAAEGLRVFEAHIDDVGVLMTDQRMPGEKGVWLLDKVRQLRPGVLRILVTAYADLTAVIDAVNSGAIYHYVNKPWDPAQLASTLKHALQLFSVQRERDQLLREKMSVLHDMMIADRIASLGFMAAGMSHHMRNALVPVKTFIDLVPQQLRDEGIDPARSANAEFWTDYQRSAQLHLDKINSLLKELWAVAETPTLAFTDRVQLRDLVSDCVMRLRDHLAAKSISVEINLPRSLPVLTVDQAKFSRMVELLLNDEIVSLPAGSRITVSAEVTGDGSNAVRISFRDNGPGLSQDILENLFDPFNARSDNPTEHGLNLMACYFIAHYHGGKIEAHAAIDGGTEFVVEIPSSPNRPMATADERALFQKIRLTDQLWQKLLASR